MGKEGGKKGELGGGRNGLEEESEAEGGGGIDGRKGCGGEDGERGGREGGREGGRGGGTVPGACNEEVIGAGEAAETVAAVAPRSKW